MVSLLLIFSLVTFSKLLCQAVPLTSDSWDPNISTKEKCYADNENPYRGFGSWTSYFAVDNDNEDLIGLNHGTCRPKSLWMFVRHGSRKPAVGQIEATNTRGPPIIEAILKNHESGNGQLCDDDLQAFKSWKPHLTKEDDHLLIQSGRNEMKILGHRQSKRLPTLFKHFDKDQVVFRSTKTQRCMESAREFFEGAFPAFDFHLPEPVLNDTVLRFYKFCDDFKDLDEIPAGDFSLEEQALFEEGPEVQGLVNRVNTKLGFVEAKLNLSDIYVMWDTCRYELQALRNPAVFCAPFTKEDLQIMEYHEELKYWRSHGFGQPNTKVKELVACPLMKKAVESLENKNVTVFFGHQDGLTTLLTMMGINEDDVAPTHNNYPNTPPGKEERKYRLSKMNPMGGNFGLLLTECDQKPKLRVSAYLHEKLIKLPKCGHTDCDWNQFKDIYKQAIECPYDEACGNTGRTTEFF